MDGVYATIGARLDYASFVPAPVPGIVRADLRKRDGTAYTVLKNPLGEDGAGTYLQLEPADAELFELMDGRRTTADILVEYLGRRGHFALDRLARLTAALAANGFFGEARVDVYRGLRQRKALRDPLARASLLLRKLIVWNIASWSNAERAVDLVYRWGGRLAFTPAGAAALLLLAVVGLVVWFREFTSPRHQLFTIEGSYLLGLAALVLLQVLSISVHEAGHALAIRHFGRRVRRLGLAMYYLFPCMYVDSTDMVLATRRQRIVVSLAGPLGGVSVGAACALVAASQPETVVGAIAFKAATLFVFQFVLNLLPILDLDGYHVLVDALDAPLLRQRALGFVRGGLPRKVRRRERWTPSEAGLAVYGLLAIVVSVLTLGFSVFIWDQRVAVLAGELLRGGPAGAIGFALLLLVFVGPLLVAVVGRVVGLGRTAVRVRAARTQRRRTEALLDRVRVLQRVPFLGGLPGPGLAAVGAQLAEEHADAGDVVMTAGEPGDRFYLVRHGELEVLSPDGVVIGTLKEGDGFGELALLDSRPRSATVRATTSAELWSLDRSHFNRWVRDRFEVAARIRSSAEERSALRALPFFRGLGPAELPRIAARLRTMRFVAGQPVFSAGDPGDRYYVIREGTAEVRLADGTPLRAIGPGEGFGELALLLGKPRTATVVATSALVVQALGRADFVALVRASGETVGQFRTRTAHYVGAGLGSAVAGD
ncbi:MAG: cyclic nucleotide-binding domain-containing protein [Candidatus Limnocylindria bacterium]